MSDLSRLQASIAAVREALDQITTATAHGGLTHDHTSTSTPATSLFTAADLDGAIAALVDHSGTQSSAGHGIASHTDSSLGGWAEVLHWRWWGQRLPLDTTDNTTGSGPDRKKGNESNTSKGNPTGGGIVEQKKKDSQPQTAGAKTTTAPPPATKKKAANAPAAGAPANNTSNTKGNQPSKQNSGNNGGRGCQKKDPPPATTASPSSFSPPQPTTSSSGRDKGAAHRDLLLPVTFDEGRAAAVAASARAHHAAAVAALVAVLRGPLGQHLDLAARIRDTEPEDAQGHAVKGDSEDDRNEHDQCFPMQQRVLQAAAEAAVVAAGAPSSSSTSTVTPIEGPLLHALLAKLVAKADAPPEKRLINDKTCEAIRGCALEVQQSLLPQALALVRCLAATAAARAALEAQVLAAIAAARAVLPTAVDADAADRSTKPDSLLMLEWQGRHQLLEEEADGHAALERFITVPLRRFVATEGYKKAALRHQAERAQHQQSEAKARRQAVQWALAALQDEEDTARDTVEAAEEAAWIQRHRTARRILGRMTDPSRTGGDQDDDSDGEDDSSTDADFDADDDAYGSDRDEHHRRRFGSAFVPEGSLDGATFVGLLPAPARPVETNMRVLWRCIAEHLKQLGPARAAFAHVARGTNSSNVDDGGDEGNHGGAHDSTLLPLLAVSPSVVAVPSLPVANATASSIEAHLVGSAHVTIEAAAAGLSTAKNMATSATVVVKGFSAAAELWLILGRLAARPPPPLFSRVGPSRYGAGAGALVAVVLAHGGHFAVAAFDVVLYASLVEEAAQGYMRHHHSHQPHQSSQSSSWLRYPHGAVAVSAAAKACVGHTTLHRYIVRKGQGGRQSAHSGSTATAGSQIRAAQEKKYVEEITVMLRGGCERCRSGECTNDKKKSSSHHHHDPATAVSAGDTDPIDPNGMTAAASCKACCWGTVLAQCRLVLVHAPGRANTAMVFGIAECTPSTNADTPSIKGRHKKASGAALAASSSCPYPQRPANLALASYAAAEEAAVASLLARQEQEEWATAATASKKTSQSPKPYHSKAIDRRSGGGSVDPTPAPASPSLSSTSAASRTLDALAPLFPLPSLLCVDNSPEDGGGGETDEAEGGGSAWFPPPFPLVRGVPVSTGRPTFAEACRAFAATIGLRAEMRRQ